MIRIIGSVLLLNDFYWTSLPRRLFCWKRGSAGFRSLFFSFLSFFLLLFTAEKVAPRASESIKMLSTSSFHATSTGNSDASVSSSSSLRASLRSKNLSARAHRARGVRANLFSAHAHREEEFLNIRRNANKQKAPSSSSSSLSLRRANRNKKLNSLRTFRLKSEGDDGESRSFSFVRARLYFSSSSSASFGKRRRTYPIGKILSLSLSFRGLLSLSLLFRDRAESSSSRRSFILCLHRVFCLHRVQYDRSV